MTGPRPQAPRRTQAALARDAALARIGHARRWVVLGSAGLSAGFAALVSTSPPSKASTAKATSSTAATQPRAARPGAEPSLPPLVDGSKLGLSGPSQSPGADGSQAPAPQVDPSQQQAPSAPQQQVAPSPQPGPVSGGS